MVSCISRIMFEELYTHTIFCNDYYLFLLKYCPIKNHEKTKNFQIFFSLKFLDILQSSALKQLTSPVASRMLHCSCYLYFNVPYYNYAYQKGKIWPFQTWSGGHSLCFRVPLHLYCIFVMILNTSKLFKSNILDTIRICIKRLFLLVLCLVPS